MRVLDGTCELHLGRSPHSDDLEIVIMHGGDTCHITPGTRHRLVALAHVDVAAACRADRAACVLVQGKTRVG